MNTTGQGRIKRSGNGISSLGHPARYAPNRPKAAPDAPRAGVGVGVEHHPSDRPTEQPNDVDDGKSLAAQPLLKRDPNEGENDDVAENVHHVTLTVEKTSRRKRVDKRRFEGPHGNEDEIGPNPVVNPSPRVKHGPHHLDHGTQQNTDRDAHGDRSAGADSVEDGGDDGHQPKGQYQPLRWCEEGHGEAHGAVSAFHSFELMSPMNETGGFFLHRSVPTPWPRPCSTSKTSMSGEA